MISIHAPPRGATRCAGIPRRGHSISIHAPPRGATYRAGDRTTMRRFQFTPLREGRRWSLTEETDGTVFQFTPLREGRPMYLSAPVHCTNFNSRPSARGDIPVRVARGGRIISIHAPPRGATPIRPVRCSRNLLFQFTPLREGRLTGSAPVFSVFYFNSRPSARGDLLTFLDWNELQYFNSRPSARGDTATAAVLSISYLFQFTPLREGRRFRLHCEAAHRYFNSRPSARGDGVLPETKRLIFYFNSRPSARGDRRYHRLPLRTVHFNSRPSARGDAISMNGRGG